MRSRTVAYRPKQLLRQPGGFEGFFWASVHRDAGYQPVLDLVEPGEPVVDFEAASLSTTTLCRDHAYRVAKVSNLLDALRVVIPCADPARDDLGKCLSALPDAGIPSDTEISLDVRVVVRKRPVGIPGEVGLIHPKDDLHVLLWHRPRSISRRTAPFHAKQNYCFSSKAVVRRAGRRGGQPRGARPTTSSFSCSASSRRSPSACASSCTSSSSCRGSSAA